MGFEGLATVACLFAISIPIIVGWKWRQSLLGQIAILIIAGLLVAPMFLILAALQYHLGSGLLAVLVPAAVMVAPAVLAVLFSLGYTYIKDCWNDHQAKREYDARRAAMQAELKGYGKRSPSFRSTFFSDDA